MTAGMDILAGMSTFASRKQRCYLDP